MKNTIYFFSLKLFLLITLFFVGGCATIMYSFDSMRPSESNIYAGTRYHIREINDLPNKRHRAQTTHGGYDRLIYTFSWWHFIDFPLSLVADTVILPYTIPRTLYLARKKRARRLPPNISFLAKEHYTCMYIMKDLSLTKNFYINHHNLKEDDKLPQTLDAYSDFLVKTPPPEEFYSCPAGGAYTLGGWNEEPACSVHGTREQAWDNISSIIREYRRSQRKD